MQIHEYMAYELIEKIHNEELSVEDIVKHYAERIEKTDKFIHSFVHNSLEVAIKKAKDIDEMLKQGKSLGKLSGLPIAVKDLICIENSPTTCCSEILKGYKPPYDATVIQRLIRKEHAISIGRTNMDEFAMGSSTETSCYGPTFNPWDLGRVPGGSSGGSGSCVAAGQVPFSLGSDTGGSIRCPASYCGVVGLKPTYGRISRYGLVAYANSLDQIGPIARCVYDCALLLEIMAGYDPLDSTTIDTKVDKYTQNLDDPIEGKTLGIPKEFFGEGLNEQVEKKVKDAIKKFETIGVEMVEVSFPHLEYTIPTYYLIAMSEASSNLARFDGLRYGEMTEHMEGDVFEVFSKTRGEKFGAEVRRRIILGTYTLSAGYYDMFYIKALKVRTLIKKDFENAFEKCDAIVCPTMPTTAFKIGELIDDPLQMYMMDILTCPVNLAGLCGLSIPCGFDNKELPIGLQLIGNYFEEKVILNLGYALEQKLQLFRKMPATNYRGA
ncbi:MAG: Asp-tRNA(Asn)/Glu-tRNA(Gln) amidotransferase subunit GatA [Candidatus Lokiarchaeota archaeon]|nr:Asp-tRNA(Asn)/Glu-tRNA(Gln) amidotransferase subunit GatA [Candidatus Lokiarchaeota archaeon]MBD3343334.1 Asp-tRNA(Asn)/Glu-tRNA(Gln) amidotransferase subunit GatA [Candidatus Lokiarchaeota archaeon]